MLDKLVAKSWRVIAHHRLFSCERRCASHLLSHSVRLFPVHLFLPRVSSPSVPCSIGPLGTGFVVHDLHPRVRADHEHFSSMHHDSMDENDLACRDLVKTEALVDDPLVNDQLYGFGLISER